jgi:biopolymer transport protein ExbD
MNSSIIAAILLATVLPSAAAEPTVEELSQRVAQLEKTVEELSKALALVADKPETKVASPPQPVGAEAVKPEIIVNVHADGGLVVEGRKFTLEELNGTLKEVAKRDKDQPIRLRCDASVTYQRIVEVIEGCQEAGLWCVSFASVRKAEKK